MALHTPGPWHHSRLRSAGPAPGCCIGAENNSNVALVHHEALDRGRQETLANARLIAAAPDLLATLEALLAKVHCGTALECPLCDAARAAIAKAKGDA
jgi:hypothetical protein